MSSSTSVSKSPRATTPSASRKAGAVTGQFRHAMEPAILVRTVRTCPLQAAVQSLMNTQVESKSGLTLDLDVLNLARGLFPPGKEYRFDLFASTSIGANGSGVILQTLAFSPSVVSYAEWPSLSALFEEVNLIRAQVTFLPLSGSNGQDLTSTTSGYLQSSNFTVAPNPDNISTNPATFQAVSRLASSRQLTRCIGDHGGVSVINYRPPRDRPYARVASPAVQDPPAGVLGSFDVAASTTVTPSKLYYLISQRVTVVLRNRS